MKYAGCEVWKKYDVVLKMYSTFFIFGIKRELCFPGLSVNNKIISKGVLNNDKVNLCLSEPLSKIIVCQTMVFRTYFQKHISMKSCFSFLLRILDQ